MGECLLNEPKDHNYPVQELLVGAIYDADQQCKFIFGDNYVNCKIGGVILYISSLMIIFNLSYMYCIICNVS